MKKSQSKKRILSNLSVIAIAFVVSISCLFSGIEVRAASTNVVNDANGDGQLTADEVDLEQLSVYGLTTGYGVLGSDIPNTIVNSDTYTEMLSTVSGNESIVLIGTVANGKVTFSDLVKSFFTALYAELTSSEIVGYTVIPSVSKQYLYDWINTLYENGTMSESGYMTAYNAFSTLDYTGALVVRNNSNYKGNVYFNFGNSDLDYVFYNYSSSTRYIYKVVNDNGAYSSTSISFNYDWCTGTGWATGYAGKVSTQPNLDMELGCVGMSAVVFNSLPEYVRYKGMSCNCYFSSNSDKGLKDTSLSYLNSYDWKDISSQIYNHVSSAVRDANVEQTNLIQGIIDSEMEDLSDIIDGDDSDDEGEDNEEPGDSDGSGSDNGLLQKIYDKLCEWLPFLENIGKENDKVTTPNADDESAMNDFSENSSGQSDSLNDLNEQMQTEKPDIDSTSDDIDQNLDIEVDANYGTLLSTFTNDKNILVMLLACVSLALISYVFFGKR